MRKFPGWGLIIGTGLFLFACANDHNLSKLQQQAEKGDAKAQIALGYSPRTQFRIKQQNQRKMLGVFLPAAKLGNAAAQTNLGILYTRLQDGEAYYWFKKAALQGDPHAVYGLGLLYHQGLGVERDLPRARRLYAAAAALGEINAVYNLGNMYARGEGGSQDYNKARELWHLAAQKGGADAMYNLGRMYAGGISVDKSYSKAKEFFQQACTQGKDDACLALDRL